MIDSKSIVEASGFVFGFLLFFGHTAEVEEATARQKWMVLDEY